MVSTIPENLTETVTTYIRQQLFEARSLAPGSKINEREVSRVLSISRAPVREALRELEEQGFVTSIKYKGWFVPDFSEEQAQEINGVRTLLEGYLFETAMRIGCYDAADLREAERLNDELIAIEGEEHGTSKVFRFLEKEMEFHLSLYAIAKEHCVLAQKLLRNLAYQVRLSLSYTDNLNKRDFMKYSIEVHRLMLRHLRERNQEAFSEIITRRLDRNKNIRDILDSQDERGLRGR